MHQNSTAVIFGAGSVGRGFLGQLFSESGYEVVFVDVDEELINSLSAAKKYTLRLAGIDRTEDRVIGPVRGVDGRSVESVAAEVARAGMIATAVGARALPAVARSIARGIALRSEEAGPLNIILCENLHDAPDILRNSVRDALPQELRSSFVNTVGFVPAVIARMSPVPTPEQRADDITLIVAEPYKVLPVDREAFRGPVPDVVGMQAVAPFAAYTDRKLFIHNASHAMLGCLGYMRGYNFGYDAIEDHWVKQHVEQALREAGSALVAEHGFEPVAFQEHVDYLLLRFTNRSLGDPVDRLARDILRKLAPGDRLVGAARLALKHGICPDGLSLGIAAALLYDNSQDPHSEELQQKMRSEGFASTLREVCEIDENEELGRLIFRHYENLKNEKHK